MDDWWEWVEEEERVLRRFVGRPLVSADFAMSGYDRGMLTVDLAFSFYGVEGGPCAETDVRNGRSKIAS